MALVETKGIGFVYWVKEHEAEGKTIDTAWMRETTPPFRVGKAIRVRINDRAFHVGLCKKSKKPFARDVEKTPEEIGKWVY